MFEIKNNSIPKEETVIVKKINGSKVIDDRGKKIGKVKKVHISPDTLSVEGITIDNGLFKGKDYIGKNYICSLSEEGAVLCETPISEYIGMKVVDSKGKEIGKVRNVYRARKTNSAYSLTIDRGLTKDDLIVTDNFIESVGDKIMLNETIREG